MAAPVPSDKVKDKEYTNWLKVTLALYYMKSGLHTFIQSEVDCLHQSLLQKVYGGQTVPLPPCTMCHASRVVRNKFTGVWAFQKRCRSYCDVWLYELLKLHTSPKSEKIYWNNSDVPSWPFKPWECAKVFMPRGQNSSNAGPSECDAQALLTLLASCTHFHPRLSSHGLGLTHTISTIRNNVVHNGEMKVSDVDRMSFIQQIIQLLEDPVSLVSLKDCKIAVESIHKINNDTVDVFFNVDLEMRALRASVNEFSQELGLERTRTSDTVDSLKEEYRHLREHITRRLGDVETKMDTIEKDVQSVKELTDTALQQQEKKYQEMYATITSQQQEIFEDFEIKINTFEKDVQSVMEQTDTALQQQEKKHQQSMEAVSASIANQGIRLDTVEENVLQIQEELRQVASQNNSCMKESPKNRGQQSDGLKQLKSQTEDILDTFRKMGFIPTSQTEEAKKLLQEKRSVVIKGNPGEGKTSTALHLIDIDDYNNQCVVVRSPRQWEKVDIDWVKIVVFEDIFGKYDLDPGRLQEWIDEYLEIIQKHVDVGKLQVIITTRNDILLKANSKLKSFKLFSSSMSLTLTSEKLNKSDKKSILNRELQRNKKDLNDDEVEQCIDNFSGLIGFPQCCCIFAGDKDLFAQGSKFFKSPEKFLVENIANLKANSFVSLAFLFCNGKKEEEYLSPSQIKNLEKYLPVVGDLALYLNITFNESHAISLRESYDHFLGLYVNKVFSHEHHSRGSSRKSYIQFSHATVCEAVGQVLGDKCPEMVVKYGESGYLYQRTYAAETKDTICQNTFIPVPVYGLMAERMLHDVVEKGLTESVVKHSALKQPGFLMKLKDELHKRNRIMDFLMANACSASRLGYSFPKRECDLSKGRCITFLQCVLQSDEDVVRLVYDYFIAFLGCTHNNKSSGCWQCEEKQELLELALYYNHFEIADKLIAMNASYTHVSLCNAARHGDLGRVQSILETLKRSEIFSPVFKKAKDALCQAFISGNQSLVEFLVKEGIIADSWYVVDAVQHRDIDVLKNVVEHLKCHNKWNPYWEQHMIVKETWKYRDFLPPSAYSGITKPDCVSEIPYTFALYIAYCNEKFDMADYLLINKVRVSLQMLPHVSRYGSQQAVARVIKDLRLCGNWDPHCDDASEGLETAFHLEKYDVCDVLIQEGVSLTMKNHFYFGSLESVKRAIQHLKDTDNWDPKCDDASKALAVLLELYGFKHNVYDLLVQEGVSLTMKNLLDIYWIKNTESVKIAIQHLKDTDNWDPKCTYVCKALEGAYNLMHRNYDVCDLLVQEGVPLTMKHIRPIILRSVHHVKTTVLRSLDFVKTAVNQLKDDDSWDPKCDYASEALANAYIHGKYDVCDLLVQEGVSLTMKNLPDVVRGFMVSFESVSKAIQHLKDTGNWDPKSEDAIKALASVSTCSRFRTNYDVYDLLVQEGVLLTMKHIPLIILRSIHHVKTAVKRMKETASWDPKCDDASKALVEAYREQKFDACDFLIHEGVSLTVKHLPGVVDKGSFESVTKAIQHLKDTDNWYPKGHYASKALEEAYCEKKYDICDLLVQEGVSLSMENFPGMVVECQVSFESVKKVMQHLKDTNKWVPRSIYASDVLGIAYTAQQHDVCDMLFQEGVSLPIMHLPRMMSNYRFRMSV